MFKNLIYLFLFVANTIATPVMAIEAVDFNLLHKYAQFSAVAYKTESAIQQLIQQHNQSLLHYDTIPGMEVAYFVSVDNDKKTTLITVRGTANIENALLDAAIQLKTDKLTGIQLHQGFAAIAETVLEEIQGKLDKNYTISTTGHSLGGAVAMILAIFLDKQGFQVEQAVTFGQPKVTNISGALQYRHINSLRVVTQRDIVPLVPPLDIVDINNLDIYWPLGKEIILQEGENYSIATGIDRVLRATNVFDKNFNRTSVLEHQITHYISLIESKTANARLKPYKNRFGFLDFFKSESSQ